MSRKISNIRLAQEFGWTLDYCDSLDDIVKAEIFGVLDGQAKVEKARHKPKPKGTR